MRNSDSPSRRLLPSLLVAGIAALGMFATLFSVWYRSATPEFDERLRIAMDEYITGRHGIAYGIAEQVEPDIESDVTGYQTREFLLGATGVHLALAEPDPRRVRLKLHEVLPPLKALYPYDYPTGRSAEAKRLLGLGYSLLGQFEEAIPPLRDSILEDPTQKIELLPLLVENQLRAGEAFLSEAQEGIDELLATRELGENTRNTVLLLKARLAATQGDFDSAYQAIDMVTDPALIDQRDYWRADIIIHQAKSMIDKATPRGEVIDSRAIPSDAREKIDQAIDILDGIYRRNDLEMGPAAQYLAANAYLVIGKQNEALSLFATLRQSARDEPEVIAAGISEVELLADRGEFDDCLQTVQVIVRDIGDPQGFDPQIMGLAELQQRLLEVPLHMWDADAYETAQQYGESLIPVVSKDFTEAIVAETFQRWGDQLQRKAAEGKEAEVRLQDEMLAREKYCLAGEHFTEVARLRYTQANYTDALWQAIQSFQMGRDFPRSLELLDDYLAYEDRIRLPRGLLAKGKALLSLGQPKKALQPLLDCIESYPRDPLGDEARLLAATALLEEGNTEKPREMLDQNLYGGQLSPENQIFRDSLFVLGEALYRKAYFEHVRIITPTYTRGRLEPGVTPDTETAKALEANQQVVDEAIAQLEEVIYRDAKHGNPERALRATYLKAQSHRMAAFWPSIQAGDPNTLEPSRRRLKEQTKEHLENALGLFGELRESLLHGQTVSGKLDATEQAMLRNCFMGIADTQYDLGQYAQAASEYQRASQEFLNDPLALEATMGEALCYSKLGKFDEEKRLYRRAEDTLSRIPAESEGRFERITRYDRDQWSSLVQWLGRP